MLEMRGITAGYGPLQVLRGVDLEIGQGEVHLLVGHNGAGKTTLLRLISGRMPTRSGAVLLDGVELGDMSSRNRIRAGVSLVPQEGIIFPSLTVRENIRLGLFPFRQRSLGRGYLEESIERIGGVFPEVLRFLDQRAGQLSGGQQRLCAIARGLVRVPRLLLLDEPSVGLSPILVDRVLEAVGQINRDLGVTVLLVEQDIRKSSRVASVVHALQQGRIILSEPSAIFQHREDLYSYF